MKPSLNYLRSLLEYRPEEGQFYWRVFRGSRAMVGQQAGRTNSLGRRQIGIDKCQIFEHQLVWLFETGEWPPQMLDHIDGDPTNNRFANLRLSNHTLNGQNQRRAQADSKTGYLGVSWIPTRKKFMARIKCAGKYKYLGYHKTAEAAHEAYLSAKRQLHPAGML